MSTIEEEQDLIKCGRLFIEFIDSIKGAMNFTSKMLDLIKEMNEIFSKWEYVPKENIICPIRRKKDTF